MVVSAMRVRVSRSFASFSMYAFSLMHAVIHGEADGDDRGDGLRRAEVPAP